MLAANFCTYDKTVNKTYQKFPVRCQSSARDKGDISLFLGGSHMHGWTELGSIFSQSLHLRSVSQ